VEGLPQDPGALGLALLAGGLLGGFVYAWLIRRAVWTSVRGSLAVGWIVFVVAGTTLGSVPFLAWRVVEDIRYTSGLDSWLVPRYGVSVYRVHPEIFDNAAQRIPPGDTYYLAASPKLDHRTRDAFHQWALGYLLPRIAVADPRGAQWILTLGVDPAMVGPRIARTWIVKGPVSGLPVAYLGKVVQR
jgi:hypothetical protein